MESKSPITKYGLTREDGSFTGSGVAGLIAMSLLAVALFFLADRLSKIEDAEDAANALRTQMKQEE